MLRVAIDAAPMLGKPTGVGVFTAGLLGVLASKEELRVDAYALSGRGARRLKPLLPAGVGHLGTPMPAGPLLKIWQHVPAPAVEFWTGPVDVVHGTNFVVPPARRAATVVTVHDLTAIRFPEMCAPVTLQYPVLVQRSIDRGAHVHVMTNAIAKEVNEYFDVDPTKVHVVAPGLVPVLDVVTEQPPTPYVLAIGTVEPRKDYPMLVRAFDAFAADHDHVRLVIAGSRGWGAEAFDTAISNSWFAHRIDHLGWIDDTRRAALLRGASALAYPSVYEGFGLPPLEAMMVGVPVVATASEAVAEVTGGAAMLVAPGDHDAFSGALADVFTDSVLREQLKSAGRDRAAQFSWSRTAAQMVAVYEETAGTNR